MAPSSARRGDGSLPGAFAMLARCCYGAARARARCLCAHGLLSCASSSALMPRFMRAAHHAPWLRMALAVERAARASYRRSYILYILRFVRARTTSATRLYYGVAVGGGCDNMRGCGGARARMARSLRAMAARIFCSAQRAPCCARRLHRIIT